MGFILHRPYDQECKMKENEIFRDEETQGLCYGLVMEWIKLVCTKVIPELTDLNIFRATSHQRAYVMQYLASFKDDPFNIFRINNSEKLGKEERFRLLSHSVFESGIRHIFNERFYSKKVLAFMEDHSRKFSKVLAQNASKYDAILILHSYSTGLDKCISHIFALSCSTGTPIIFNPNGGQYIYSNYSGDILDLNFALLRYSDSFYRRLFAYCDYYIIRRYAAVWLYPRNKEGANKCRACCASADSP